MDNYQIVLPRITRIGKGAVNELARVMKSFNVNHPLIVTDAMMVKLGYVEQLQTLLDADNKKYGIYADTVPEPTDTSIKAGIDKVRQGGFDSVIAIGGGSVIDSAKAISVVGKLGGQIRDYKFPRDVSIGGFPLIAIPTTAGTGSEVTKATVITDEARNEKMLCMGAGFVPVAALVDYTLTLSLPPRVTADSGLDALTHAIEAYVSRQANPFTDVQALAAMQMVGQNLRTVYQNPKDEAGRAAMMLGAHLAGIAFANASVALVHGMSRPIGAHFHVPHGLSNAMLLPDVTAFSIPAATERYATCARVIGVADSADTDQVACQKLVAELTALNRDLQVPTLKDFGVNQIEFEALLPTMAEQAKASGSPDNNPRQPTLNEMVELYRQVYEAN